MNLTCYYNGHFAFSYTFPLCPTDPIEYFCNISKTTVTVIELYATNSADLELAASGNRIELLMCHYCYYY